MSRWLPPWRRRSREDDLDAELRYHLERRFEDCVRAGIPPDEARRRVAIEFGPVALAKDECRDIRRFHRLAEFARDLRLGLRALSRERLIAASVIFVLALGIGATLSMFSVLDGIVLRPLPYDNWDRLVVVASHDRERNQFEGTSAANFLDWRQMSTTFDGMEMYRRISDSRAVYMSADAPRRVQEGLVGADFFQLLGATPLLGRTFSREEFAGHQRAVLLSEGLWQDEFGRAADAIGRPLVINGETHVIVGVMPGSFQLPTPDTRLWRPLSVLGKWWDDVQHIRDGDSFEVIGRLAPTATVEDAAAEMAVIASRLREAHDVNRRLDVRVTSLFDHVVGARTARSLWMGFAAVLALLAIACANAGGLLAVRAARRRRELAVRVALGAGRGRLVRQLLAESVGLWIVASTAGLVVAKIAIGLLDAFGLAGLPRSANVGLDVTAILVAYAGGLAVVAAAGTLPALLALGTGAAEGIASRDQAPQPRHRLHGALVTGQIAGAMTLVVAAVLLALSFVRVNSKDPGYPATNLLVARIERPSVPDFFLSARERLQRIPGVVAVGGITDFFVRRAGDQSVTVEGQPVLDPNESRPRLVMDSVTPGYFQAMSVALLDGRDFDDRDVQRGAAPVLIVNDALARRYWPGERAVGKRLVGGTSPPENRQWATVVGVVTDLRREGLEEAPILQAFMPNLLQRMDMTIRVAAADTQLTAAIRQELRAIDPALPVPGIVRADQRLFERLSSRRLETGALVAFSVIALLLATIGLYGTLAYQVTLRTREIGLRAALGADRPAIVRMFVGRGMRLAAAGTLLGLAGAISTARLLQSLLYETPAIDGGVYAGTAAFVLCIATFAAWWPARRAARVSPMTALRN